MSISRLDQLLEKSFRANFLVLLVLGDSFREEMQQSMIGSVGGFRIDELVNRSNFESVRSSLVTGSVHVISQQQNELRKYRQRCLIDEHAYTDLE